MNDDDKKRLFVAAIPNRNWRGILSDAQAVLPSRAKLIPPEKLHLTIYFAGQIPAARIDELKIALANFAADSIPVSLDGARIFTPTRSGIPSMLWLKFNSSAQFRRLSAGCRRIFIGDDGDAKNENRPQIPHITLARFNSGRVILSLPNLNLAGKRLEVGEISLMLSADGRYQSLAAFPLGRR